MATPDNGKNIISSINPVLNNLLANRAYNLIFAVVAADGTGHYLLPSTAVTAGAKYIFIKNGDYTETADITLTQQSLIGQSTEGVKITLTGATIGFADSPTNTVAGTAHPTYDDKTIVGTATTFTTVPAAAEYKFIFADRILSEIDTITDNLNLELLAKYFGRTTDRDGVDFALTHRTFDQPDVGSSIENLTIIHNPAGADNAIELSGLHNRLVNVHIKSGVNALTTHVTMARVSTEIAVDCLIDNCSFEGGQNGIILWNAHHCAIRNSRFSGMSAACVIPNTNSQHISFTGCAFTSSARGVHHTITTATHFTFLHCVFAYTYNEAINWDAGGAALYSKAINCTFHQCHPNAGLGTTLGAIQLDAGQCEILHCLFNFSQNAIYIVDATICKIIGNTFHHWGSYAIFTTNFSDIRNIIVDHNIFQAESGHVEAGVLFGNAGAHISLSHNQFKDVEDNTVSFEADFSQMRGNNFDNCGNAIYLIGHNNICQNNIVTSDAGVGIKIAGDRNIVSNNQVDTSVDNNIEIEATADQTICNGNVSLNSGALNLLNNGTNTDLGHNIIV